MVRPGPSHRRMLQPGVLLKLNRHVHRRDRPRILRPTTAPGSNLGFPFMQTGRPGSASGGMDGKNGIAAASVTAVVFSLLLISGLAVFISSQNRATMYAAADKEGALSDAFVLLEGAGAANFLNEIQVDIGSKAMGCYSAGSTLSQFARTSTDLQESGGVQVTTSGQVIPASSRADNLSTISPYNGSVSDGLDFELRASAKGGSGGITLNRNETHFVHLGVHVQSAVADCANFLGSIARSLAASTPSNCTFSDISPVYVPLIGTMTRAAAGGGFVLQVSVGLSTGPHCSADVVVRLGQLEIQGISGRFDAWFEEEATVPIRPRVG